MPSPAASERLSAWPVDGLPEVRAGDDLAALIGELLEAHRLETGDIVVVTSKIVSKAEGRQVAAEDRAAAIESQTVRVVAERGGTRIVENPLGLIMAAGGVDASNAPEGVVLLLPEDPDATARVLAAAWRARFGVDVGVIITDTSGRAWRQGQTDIAIGAGGVQVSERPDADANGRPLHVTLAAVADEIAGLAELATGKATARPVSIVRGLGRYVTSLDAPGARALIRSPENDLFRLGADEAWREGYAAGLRAAQPEDAPTIL